MPNTLQAIYRVVTAPVTQIRAVYKARTNANSVGDALEEYIKDLFADCLNEQDERQRILRHAAAFSYLGNQNNPPDMILKGGDAIETKKIQSGNNALALNSSYPKAKLYIDNPMLNATAKTCESWEEKDLLFTIGHTTDTSLVRLWFLYGDCYAADKGIYERIRTQISEGVNQIPGVVFSKSKELGRVNKVDPLGITRLRIRGMWSIENPNKVFSYLDVVDRTTTFQFIGLMRKQKFESFSAEDQEALFKMNVPGFTMADVKVKDPNNPANLIDCVLISYNKY